MTTQLTEPGEHGGSVGIAKERDTCKYNIKERPSMHNADPQGGSYRQTSAGKV